ncbi:MULTISPECIES: serine/threonine-protein kinase [unclassified Nocardiopsis]|uniref:serine/threonine-protein kinase n=1 Tax=Nocardiopsis TaxID=2013 RepID=UPI00387ADCB7
MPPTERIVASRYRLTGRLGSGGMGTVWQAFDPRLEREVAIKEVHLPTGLSDEEQRTAKARMMREARTAARIGHPSVVTVHDVLEEDGVPYIVMALLDGSSLEEVLEEHGPLPPARVAAIARAVLEALRAAHRAGVVHRDIKPANIMVSADGERVVLTDFGIANLMEGASSSLTGTGMVVGTPEYMAPERLEQGQVAEPSDLWSLGATLYAALSGDSPFKRDSLTATLSAIVAQPIPVAETEEPLASVVNGLLVRETGRRLTADRALELLDTPAPHPAAPTAPAPAPKPTAPLPPSTGTPNPGPQNPGTPNPAARNPTAQHPAAQHPTAQHTAAHNSGAPAPGPRPQPGVPQSQPQPRSQPQPQPHRAAAGPPPSAHRMPAHPAPHPGAPRAAGYAPGTPMHVAAPVHSAPAHSTPHPTAPRPAVRSSRAGLWWGLGGGCLLLVFGLMALLVIVPGAMWAANGEGPEPLPSGPGAEPSPDPSPDPGYDPSQDPDSDYTPFENEYVSLSHPAGWEPQDTTAAEQQNFPDTLSYYRFTSPDAARQFTFTVFTLDEESAAQTTSDMQIGWEESLQADGAVEDWERLGLEELTGLPAGQRGSDMEATFVTDGSGWAEPHRWMVWRFLVVDDSTAYYLQFNGEVDDRDEYRPMVDEVFASFAAAGS